MLVTKKCKIPIASSITRIVHGGRGDYIEIADKDIIKDNIFIPYEQQWRVSLHWRQLVFYDWWTTDDKVKLYFQRKKVSYADYKVGFWYISPTEVEEVSE